MEQETVELSKLRWWSSLKYFKKITNTNNKLVNIVSINLNKDDEEEIIENTYFDLFCHNEFEKDIYNTNKKFYFEEILKENGFIISRKGETQKLSNVKVNIFIKLIKFSFFYRIV